MDFRGGVIKGYAETEGGGVGDVSRVRDVRREKVVRGKKGVAEEKKKLVVVLSNFNDGIFFHNFPAFERPLFFKIDSCQRVKILFISRSVQKFPVN